MKCYKCGKTLSKSTTNENESETHEEHIIHNAILGRLTTDKILCKSCGNEYSKDDAKFVECFSGFLDRLSSVSYSKQHGTKAPKSINGFILDLADDKIECKARNGVYTPCKPYVKIDEDHKTVSIFTTNEGYKEHFLKNHPEYASYTIHILKDMAGYGTFAYDFSEGNPDFNNHFKTGMVKIAVEFALNVGVDRTQLPLALKINDDGTSDLDTTRTPVIPYMPHDGVSMIYELGRDVFDISYPAHILKLFTQNKDSGEKTLVCYVELFSTFQYFIVLNTNYTGTDIDETYVQKLIPRKESNESSRYDLEDGLSESRNAMVKLFYSKETEEEEKHFYDYVMARRLIDSIISDEGINQAIEEICSNISSDLYRKYTVYHYDDAEPSFVSTVDQCASMKQLDQLKEYTTFKFNQLNRFCWQIK